jgi:hypothetical protein
MSEATEFTPEERQIPEASPPTAVTPPQPTPPKPKKRKMLVILGAITLLLLTPFAATAYGGVNLPLVSDELSLQLQKLYAGLPLVPKAPRHILLQSIESSMEIKTFIVDASVSMAGLGVALYGDIEIKEDAVNFDLHLTGYSSQPTFPLSLEADLINLDDALYFKVETFDSSLLSDFIDLSPIIGEWWRFSSGISTEPEEGSIAQEAQHKILELLSHPEITKIITKAEDEKIGEELCYRLRITPTKESFVKLVELIQEESLTNEEKKEIEEGFEEIDRLEVDLWIGKETSLVRKVKILFKLKSSVEGLDAATYLGLSGMSEAALEITLPKINSPVSITAPKGARGAEELFELLLGEFDLEDFDMEGFETSLPAVLGEQTKLLLERR